MRFRIGLSLIGLLAACSGDTAAPEPTGTGETTLAASAGPEPEPATTGHNATATNQIPVALQGRWGLVPGDCTTTRGDDKGLLTIGASDLRHYESVGKLRSVSSATTNSINGTFDYTGEGMNWTREVTLTAQNDGKSLDFRDKGSDGPPGNRTYTRCPG